MDGEERFVKMRQEEVCIERKDRGKEGGRVV